MFHGNETGMAPERSKRKMFSVRIKAKGFYSNGAIQLHSWLCETGSLLRRTRTTYVFEQV